jgi:hypothetical protein
MNHFRNQGMEYERKWVKNTYRMEKANNTRLPHPFAILRALIGFYILKRKTEYQRHEEISNKYIQYCKACLLCYILIFSKAQRRKARQRKSLAKDTLQASLTVHSCRKCDSKKVLDSLKIIIKEGEVLYECRKCPQKSENRQEQKERRKRQRTTHKQRGADLNYYRRLLGLVGKELTKEKIEKAYREKVKECHPDAGGSEEKFKKVQEAKEELNKYAVAH